VTKSVKFFTNAIRGKKVGAIARSSRFVVRDILEEIEGSRLDVVVEYGAGDGVVTHEILKKLSAKGKLLAVEPNINFVNLLQKIEDPRLIVISGTIQEVSENLNKLGFNNVDLILSSIPFSLIEKEDRERVVKNTVRSLKAHGKFIIFHQYSKLMQKYLKKYFKNIKTFFEPMNFFPCFIITATKD
jgi:phospholipid N-methyltransferase